jgi:hypothetical protein
MHRWSAVSGSRAPAAPAAGPPTEASRPPSPRRRWRRRRAAPSQGSGPRSGAAASGRSSPGGGACVCSGGPTAAPPAPVPAPGGPTGSARSASSARLPSAPPLPCPPPSAPAGGSEARLRRDRSGVPPPCWPVASDVLAPWAAGRSVAAIAGALGRGAIAEGRLRPCKAPARTRRAAAANSTRTAGPDETGLPSGGVRACCSRGVPTLWCCP